MNQQEQSGPPIGPPPDSILMQMLFGPRGIKATRNSSLFYEMLWEAGL